MNNSSEVSSSTEFDGILSYCVSPNKKTLFDKWKMDKLLEEFLSLCKEVKRCHELGFYHGNIKTSNILDKNGKLSFMNFDSAWKKEEYKDSLMLKITVPTHGYFLPWDYQILEKIDDIFEAEKYRWSIDIFGLGVSMYEMISPNKLYSREFPSLFEEENFNARKERILQNLNVKLFEEPSFSQGLAQLFAKMMHPMAKSRPTIYVVIEKIKSLSVILKELSQSPSRLVKNNDNLRLKKIPRSISEKKLREEITSDHKSNHIDENISRSHSLSRSTSEKKLVISGKNNPKIKCIIN